MLLPCSIRADSLYMYKPWSNRETWQSARESSHAQHHYRSAPFFWHCFSDCPGEIGINLDDYFETPMAITHRVTVLFISDGKNQWSWRTEAFAAFQYGVAPLHYKCMSDKLWLSCTRHCLENPEKECLLVSKPQWLFASLPIIGKWQAYRILGCRLTAIVFN